MTKIAVIVGSIRADSFNVKLAKTLEQVALEGVEFIHADISELPLFNQDLEAEFPAAARALKDVIESADGVLVVTPEYNRSIPGVLKNAIDWASRPWGSNSFNGKPAGIVGASISPLGTATAQAHLKDILVYLNTKLLGQPEVYLASAQDVFNDAGEATDSWKESLTTYVKTFVAHVEASK